MHSPGRGQAASNSDQRGVRGNGAPTRGGLRYKDPATGKYMVWDGVEPEESDLDQEAYLFGLGISR
jgi:hypothetical protein